MIKTCGIKAKKKWGQNFLTDKTVLNNIVQAAGIEENDNILEVGAGLGALTEELLKTGALVTAVEIDKSLVDILKVKFALQKNLHLIEGDILDMTAEHLLKGTNYKVVANLPYYITTPLIFFFMEMRENIASMLLMMQKEVAERIVATPKGKAYGVLSVMVQYFAETEIVFDVPPEAFRPQPKVYSSVVRIVMRDRPAVAVKDEKCFFSVVRAAFAQRRKTLNNNLRAYGLTAEETLHCLAAADIEGNRRGETLSLQEFAKLADVIFERSQAV